MLSVGLREGVTQEVALELSSGFLRLHTQQGTQRAQKQGSLNEAPGFGDQKWAGLAESQTESEEQGKETC